MTDIFAIETSTRTAGLAVRAGSGFRFYASDRIFAALERRDYTELKDIHAAVRRLAGSPSRPTSSPRRGKRRARLSRR